MTRIQEPIRVMSPVNLSLVICEKLSPGFQDLSVRRQRALNIIEAKIAESPTKTDDDINLPIFKVLRAALNVHDSVDMAAVASDEQRIDLPDIDLPVQRKVHLFTPGSHLAPEAL